ncbi:MAG: MATE family efflux transporter [Acidobacteriota bacterium]|jgi:putative MATE family efflux protein|nr:MATE family efflux transporter [Acidobacteriota bacterium]
MSILDTDRIGKLLFKLALPAFFGMLVMALYNVVDTIFIGRYVGSLGIAGLSVVFPFQMLAQGFGMMAGIGGASLVSRSLGAKDLLKSERALGNALLLGSVFGIFMSIIILANMDFWLSMAGASESIMPYAREYMEVVISFAILMTLVMTFHSVVIAEGNAKLPMISMICGAVMNIILDALFVITFQMGIRGAAIATMISNGASLLCFLWYYLSGRSTLKLELKIFIPDFRVLRQIVVIGVSGLAMTLSNSFSAIFLNNLLLQHGGDMAISTFGLINRAMVFIFMPCMVIGQGMQPIIGFNYGARQYDRVFRALKISLSWATGIAIAGFLVFYFFPGPIMRIFTTEQDLIAHTVYASKRMFLAIYLLGFISVSSIVFQALGKAVQSFIASVARPALILIPTLLVLSSVWRLDGIWYTFPVTDVLTALVILLLLIPLIRDLRKRRDSEKPDVSLTAAASMEPEQSPAQL